MRRDEKHVGVAVGVAGTIHGTDQVIRLQCALARTE